MPPILTEPKTWRKARPANETRRSVDLTPTEAANVKRALRFLSRRFGGWAGLAEATKANQKSLVNAASARKAVSAGIALRAARAARVPLEDVLAGRWPVEGACPMCGRHDDDRS